MELRAEELLVQGQAVVAGVDSCGGSVMDHPLGSCMAQVRDRFCHMVRQKED